MPSRDDSSDVGLAGREICVGDRAMKTGPPTLVRASGATSTASRSWRPCLAKVRKSDAGWQVLRLNIVASRFEALHGSSLTRLVGRDEEIDLLLRRWARIKTGDGQVVLISGEPGIGKSRIATELEQRLARSPIHGDDT